MRWLVITPEYDEVVPILDDGTGPIEYGCDVIEIEAESRRDAIALGVNEMLKGGRQNEYGFYKWCRMARSDGESPYAGVRAEIVLASEKRADALD
jgi:hypothetical protein